MNLNNVMIGSDNAEAMVEYYTRLFGEPQWREGDYIGWQLGSGSLTVAPHSEVHGKNAHPGRHIINLESDDVRGDFERLAAAGAIVVREPYSFEELPDAWVATLADPDDNYFQLVSPMGPA